jgi:DNA polymerase III sliding clamp (beta) subunit (PCNA family)
MNDTTNESVVITLTNDELGSLASLVACTHDENTPILTGIRVTVTDGQLVALATDRYQAVRLTLAVTAADVDVVLPAKWLAGFYASAKKIKYDSENVLTITGNVISLENERAGLTLGTTTVYGQYPDLNKLFPGLNYEPVTHMPLNVNAKLLATLVKLTLPADAGYTPAKRNSVWRMQNTLASDPAKNGPLMFIQQSKVGQRESMLELLIQPVILPR